MEKVKKCGKCNEMKPVGSFYLSKQRSGRYIPASYCKQCNSNIEKEKHLTRRKEIEKARVVDLLGEVWLDIHGWNGLYMVSNLGRVKRLKRVVWEPQWSRYKNMPEKLMTLTDNGDGYLKVSLTYNGKKWKPKVHQLVATHFVPNPQGKLVVNHLLGNKSDNRACMLEWVTIQENVDHKYAVLGYKHLSDELPTCKPVLMIGPDGSIKEFPSISSAARSLGGAPSNVSAVLRGVNKLYKGYNFKFLAR